MLKSEIHENRLKILGKLTANFVHEIRNPLSVIKLNLSYLNMLEEKLPTEVCNSINNTSEAVERIQNLLEVLTDFTKKNHGNISTNLAEIINTSYEFVKGNAKRFNINIEKEIDKKIHDIFIDKNKIIQVLLNLLTFTIDFSNPGTLIKLKAFSDKSKKIIIEIEGDVNKLSEKEKERIIDYLVKNRTKGNLTDLGISNSILKEFNADLQFKNISNKNSKFIIKFKSSLTREKNEL